MIAYLTGTVQKKLEKAIILNTNGVGYLVHVIPLVIEKITEGAQTEFFIHTKVREDDISLFGFETYQELTFFQTVLNVNGIGPKLALEILSHNPIKVKTAILKGDVGALSKIPGIGKNTVEAETKEVEGTRVNVATPLALYRLKKGTVRSKDHQDAAAVRERFNLKDED